MYCVYLLYLQLTHIQKRSTAAIMIIMTIRISMEIITPTAMLTSPKQDAPCFPIMEQIPGGRGTLALIDTYL